MKRSKIGWADYSGGDLNFVTGCTAVSEGCRHCYALAVYERFGLDFGKVRVHPDKLARLAKMQFGSDNKRGHHSKPLVFVCDTGDLFHPDVPTDFIIQAFEIMASRKDVDWVVLTKRPQMMRETLFGHIGQWYLGGGDYFPNIWMGVTAENQEMVNQRLPILLDAWPGKTFVSVEPMLEAMDLEQYLVGNTQSYQHLRWVIVGAESGPHRREFQISWARELWQQCCDNGVPFFGKQDSGLRPGEPLLFPGNSGVVWEWPE